MDVLDKIREIMNSLGWTEYKLSKESGLSQSTISNIFVRNTIPTIPTLEAICRAFGMTLSQFFEYEKQSDRINGEYKDLITNWNRLTHEQKQLIFEVMQNFK